MRKLLLNSWILLWWCLGIAGLAPAQAAADVAAPLVKVVTNRSVLPAKFQVLAPIAERAGVRLEHVDVGTTGAPVGQWLPGASLVVLDTPRPSARAEVDGAIGENLRQGNIPWLRVGSRVEDFGGMTVEQARQLSSYYTNGGVGNFGLFFQAVKDLVAGRSIALLPAAEPVPETGFYHPAAPQVFESLEPYLAWARARMPQPVGHVAFLIHNGVVSDMQTQLIDALITAAEARNILPLAFWYDSNDPKALTKVIKPAGADAMVNLRMTQNSTERAAELAQLGIPVIQTLTYREGDQAQWLAAPSGVAQRVVPIFMAIPETWGMSDPMVLSALQDGAAVPMAEQVDGLLDKLRKLIELRRKPASDRQLALMFWNYPPGERNFGASHLNVPVSIENITGALKQAGYDIDPIKEVDMIEKGQAMLSMLYRSGPPEDLLARDLAAVLPVSQYQAWLDKLPAGPREGMAVWGNPADHWAVRTVDGVPAFVIPRMKLGKLVIMPQMPRAAEMGSHYHDESKAPDHLYMAAYLWLREVFGANALIHLGTHGTQEWLPGKDRGLSMRDYPFLALGDLPVFYPYIQDNVGEALQTRRRGRAVSISHQTPPFAPAGLYDELRDMLMLIEEYEQLDEGAVQQAVMEKILAATRDSSLIQDLGWQESQAREDFSGFLQVLHDHLQSLAQTAMPLGLHRFGQPSAPEHRLFVVMQQLGQPFYEALGLPDGVLAEDFTKLQSSVPYQTLSRYLREGEDIATAVPELQAHLRRAQELDAGLADTGEMEALLSGLSGGFVLPGPGGDPIRRPGLASGRNLYALEPDKLPTPAAYESGGTALMQLVDTYRSEHQGVWPQRLAFSLWAGEAVRHQGITEGQVLQALGLKPVWARNGRISRLEIIPATTLGRPRIDVVIQTTGVYRDQFDGFMRLLAEAMNRLAELDEPDNPVASNTKRITAELLASGMSADEAGQAARYRIFSSAPGNYGTGLPGMMQQSTQWEGDAALAGQFLNRMQYAYGSEGWAIKPSSVNLLAAQLRGTDAAVMSRTSNIHGVLSTDHPFEFLGGLSVAIRHLDGKSPPLYISDLRKKEPKTTSMQAFLSNEMRVRYLNPHWIQGMQTEGYAGTLEVVDTVNNLFGWQAVDPATVRPDQWQAIFDTYIEDTRQLGTNEWFEQHNPTAQAQLLERMAEAIRKGYWDAPEATRQALAGRWQELAQQFNATAGDPLTQAFVADMAQGFGLAQATAQAGAATPEPASAADGQAPSAVSGQVMQPVETALPSFPWMLVFSLSLLGVATLYGALRQWRGTRTGHAHA
ncbi:cobaltochelatase subunit CobN [Advenella alkanexedens]|uniref:cobaltochelatase subunit CobN n=1 Tax=Advenella alkanexedens TaxID=1481665 RepID=UPI0026767D12|nr:cobaltochelatase subunit CobN [Advenella alkanexedens]WKU19483.1 cobaltochelatase subunit CobN [Advenella alkanexedens]